MYYYQVYGHVLESNVAIPELHPAQRRAVPDLQMEFGVSSHGVSTVGYTLQLTSEYWLGSGEPLARLYESPTAYLLHHIHVADFVVSKPGQRISAIRLESASAVEVRLLLIGGVLSFALELHGTPSLHASAVSTTSGGVAFLGGVGAGKSTLAASFVEAGYSLLTDDVLALGRGDDLVWVYSGCPQMRLWPNDARYFLGHYEGLERVLPANDKRRVPVGANGFGMFCDEPQPLVCLYVPVRRNPSEGGTRIKITTASPRDAVIELTRHSYTVRAVEAIGLQPQRLDFFVDMVRRVPVRRIVYPSGVEHLARVREAILADLGTL